MEVSVSEEVKHNVVNIGISSLQILAERGEVVETENGHVKHGKERNGHARQERLRKRESVRERFESDSNVGRDQDPQKSLK